MVRQLSRQSKGLKILVSAVRSRPTPRKASDKYQGLFYFMYFVYILYSISSGKTYVGFTNNVERRLHEHNLTESSGFTLRYRPWTLIRTEKYSTKQEAMAREKLLKTGKGRDEIKNYIAQYLSSSGAVSAEAEKD